MSGSSQPPAGGAERDGSLVTVVGDTDASAPQREPIVGRRMGRYMVLEILGRGGMGVVYAAYDPELDRKVALKVLRLRDDPRRTPRNRQRLLREAQAMARLAHPNVIGVHDVGTFEDQVFLAMEFVAGVTLGTWRHAEPRPWRAIRDAYLAAGRGLAAAHAAGLVHRDFKPDNVLIDAAGRVRVTDFGLARADDTGATGESTANAKRRDEEITTSATSGALATSLTQVGARLGTPAYMAPEQHAGEVADAASDQFSFCVSLYEALYDRPPFFGVTAAELAVHVLDGALRPPPSGSPVPAPVRRAVLRGLSREPAQRWPTMDALLDALAFEPVRRRRRLVAGAGIVTLTAAAAFIGARTNAPVDPCRDAGSELRQQLDGPRGQQLAAAFAATGRQTAGAVWTHGQERLLAYADRFQAVAHEHCLAVQLGNQDSQTGTQQASCLATLREEFEAQLTVWDDVDLAMLDRFAEAIGHLRRPEDCAQLQRLQQIQALPDDPEVRSAIEATRGELAQVHALVASGRYAQAATIAASAADAASGLHWAPLDADALLGLAKAQGHAETFEQTLPTLDRAIAAAAQSGDSQRLLRTWTTKAHHLALSPNRQQDALAVLDVVDSMVSLAGEPPSVRADVGSVRGTALLLKGEFDQARHAYEAMFADAEVAAAATPATYGNYAAALLVLGEYDTARRVMLQAYQTQRVRVGGDHPALVEAAANIAITFARQGDYPQALKYVEEALAIDARLGGQPEPMTAVALLVRTEVELSRLQLEQAEATLDAAAAVARIREPNGGRLDATIALGRARILAERGDTRRALEILTRRRLEFLSTFGDPSSELALLDVEFADIVARSGDPVAAVARLRRSVSALVQVLGDTHPVVAMPRADLGALQAALGDITAAESNLRHAITRFEASGGDPQTFARAYASLARLVPEAERAHLSARADAQLLRADRGETSPDQALDAWLAARAAATPLAAVPPPPTAAQ